MAVETIALKQARALIRVGNETEAFVNAIQEARQAGVDNQDIANLIGIDTDTLYRILRNN